MKRTRDGKADEEEHEAVPRGRDSFKNEAEPGPEARDAKDLEEAEVVQRRRPGGDLGEEKAVRLCEEVEARNTHDGVIKVVSGFESKVRPKLSADDGEENGWIRTGKAG